MLLCFFNTVIHEDLQYLIMAMKLHTVSRSNYSCAEQLHCNNQGFINNIARQGHKKQLLFSLLIDINFLSIITFSY